MSRFVALIYHNISDAERGDQYTLPWREFRRHLQWMMNRRTQATGFAALEKYIRAKTAPPDLTITFDDGHRSNLQAATELAELGIRATVFVTPSFCIDRSDFLKPAELRALHRVADVGTHGYTHQPLTALDRRALDRELIDSKIWLEDIIGAEVRYMAAPGGYINDRVTEACLSAGYHLIGNSVEWWNRVPGHMTCHTVNRVTLRRGWPIETFEAILRRDPVFYLKRQLRRAMLATPKQVILHAKYNRLRRATGGSPAATRSGCE
jgi:peptidoglycan/xylan/chitin deacetylase (PgdA/CDA1 family)